MASSAITQSWTVDRAGAIYSIAACALFYGAGVIFFSKNARHELPVPPVKFLFSGTSCAALSYKFDCACLTAPALQIAQDEKNGSHFANPASSKFKFLLNGKDILVAKENALNFDPITSAPGAHLLGDAIDGAAASAFGGPAGTVVGGLAGVVAGGLGRKAIAESVNLTAEEAYWLENYIREPYYEAGRPFDDYAPAYRLGLYGFTQYQGSFDDTETRLAADWDLKKDTSALTWSQARLASRAAWERISRQTGNAYAGVQESSVGPVADNDEVIDTLNDLLESCRDGEYGFTASAEHARSSDIKTLLRRRAGECRGAGLELQTLIRQLGGEADEGGSISAAFHRGWVSVRGTLSGHSDQAMLDECERGEDAAVARYRKALRQNLPSAIRSFIERQAQDAQRNHDQVKALRDALKAAG